LEALCALMPDLALADAAVKAVPCNASESAAEARHAGSNLSAQTQTSQPHMEPPGDCELLVPRPGSPGSAASIAALLAECSPANLRQTLRNLALAARTQGQESWDAHFGRVLILVLDTLTKRSAKEDRGGLQDGALLCLQEMIVHHPDSFSEFAEVVASKLFEAHRSCTQADRQTLQTVDSALERLVGILHPIRASEILLPVVSTERSPLLPAATRLLSTVMQRMTPSQVLQHLPVVMPAIVIAFGNESPEARKAAVFCLVDVYMLVGEQVMPILAQDLTPSQLKLVTIYVGRQQREREDLAAGSSSATKASTGKIREQR